MTDAELITAVRHGDAEAWRELYERWLPWVWRYAYSLVQDQHLAEDVTSEAMTAWVSKVSQTGADAPQVAAWLRSVVRNKVADHHRKSYRHRKAVERLGATALEADYAAPCQPLERVETQGQIGAALDRLPETHRLCLEWKYAQGLSVRQIAQRLGATEKSVEANLYRARREFRVLYDALGADPPPAVRGPATPPAADAGAPQWGAPR